MYQIKKTSYRLFFISIAISFLFLGLKQINHEDFGKDEFVNVLQDGMLAFTEPYGEWIVENGQLILPVKNEPGKRNNIWLKNIYRDFILELDFKFDTGTNSGVFMRTVNIADPVQTGIEIQIRDDYGKSPIDKNFCGSVYDIKEISENRVKKPGEWNHLKIMAEGTILSVFLNEGKVIDINLTNWEEAGKNPDGSANKFKTAYKDMTHPGRIGFQDHGGKVWYRNIRIKEL